MRCCGLLYSEPEILIIQTKAFLLGTRIKKKMFSELNCEIIKYEREER